MSDPNEHSESNSHNHSMDERIHISANEEGENEIFVPVWEEGSSSQTHTQVNYLMEQVRILKNKCHHLEAHIEESQHEFVSLNQLYLICQNNERRIKKENEELRRRLRQTSNELIHLKVQLEGSITEITMLSNKELEWREKISQYRKNQASLNQTIHTLQLQLEELRRRLSMTPAQADEEQRWKKIISEERIKIQLEWKSKYQGVQKELDEERNKFRTRDQDFRKVSKTYEKYREQVQERIKVLEGELEEKKRQFQKMKAGKDSAQARLKQAKAVIDEISTKNDKLEGQKDAIKKKYQEQVTRYNRLTKDYKELQRNLDELKRLNEDLERENQKLKKEGGEMKAKLSVKEREVNELSSEVSTLKKNVEYIEGIKKGLKDELQKVKRSKEEELQRISDTCEERIKDVKKIHQQDKNKLNSIITDLQRQIRQLNLKVSVLTSRITSQSEVEQDKEEIIRAREQLLRAREEVGRCKTDLDKANKTIRELEARLSNNRDCGHLVQIEKLKLSIQRLNKTIEENKRNIDQQTSSIEAYKKNIEEKTNKVSAMEVRIRSIEAEKSDLDIQKEKLEEENSSLLDKQSKLELLIVKLRKDLEAAGKKNQGGKADQQKTELEGLLEDRNNRIAELEDEIQLLRAELDELKKKGEGRAADREKIRKLEFKCRDLENASSRVTQLEEQIQILQGDLDAAHQKIKSLEKDLKLKDTELAKKDKRIKHLQNELEDERMKENDSEREVEGLREEAEQLRRKMERLKQEGKRNQQHNSHFEKLYEEEKKQRLNWEQKWRDLSESVKDKDRLIQKLKAEVARHQSIGQNAENNSTAKPSQLENELRQTIKEMRLQIIEKDRMIQNLRQENLKKDQKQDGSGVQRETLESLQEEYKKELIALKRLIAYRGGKQDDSKKMEQMRRGYEERIEAILKEYNIMQHEMMLLKDEVLAAQPPVIAPPLVVHEPKVDLAAVEDVWRCKVEELSAEKEMLIDKVGIWERNYDELRSLFEAKLQSKEEMINLLTVRISNLEMCRSRNTCSCYGQSRMH